MLVYSTDGLAPVRGHDNGPMFYIEISEEKIFIKDLLENDRAIICEINIRQAFSWNVHSAVFK